MKQPPTGLPALARAALKVAWSAVVLAAILRFVARFTVDVAWDDAHMFGRYAANVLQGGSIAWNPSGPPTYGLTSLHFLWVVLPLRGILATYPGLATSLASLIPAVLFLSVAVPRLARPTPARRQSWIDPALLLGLFCLVVRAESPFFEHAGSGMDTAFAMSFVAGYLLLARGLDETPTAKRAVAVGLLGAVSFGVRPDLLVFATLVPVALLARARDRSARRWCQLALGITVLGLALQLAFNAAYFGSMLPLPFHAKATGLYKSPALVAKYEGLSAYELALFFEAFWPAFAIVGLDLALNLRSWLSSRRRFEAAVLVSTIIFGGFYACFVMSIMGQWERFYMPLLPALFLLTAASVRELADRFEPASGRMTSAASLTLALLVIGTTAPAVRYGAAETINAHRRGALADFDVRWAYRQRHSTYWYCLDAVATLPDDLVIASTEVGLPGALAPNKAIVDLAGLNDPDFAFSPFSADRLFAKVRPDLIYMPHPDYDAMVRDLEGAFAREQRYELFTASQLGTAFGVALDRESRYYDALHAMLERCPSRAP